MKDNFEFAIIHLENAMHFADLKLKDAAQRNDMELYDNLIIVKNVQATTMKALRIAAKVQELGTVENLDEATNFFGLEGSPRKKAIFLGANNWNELQKVMNDDHE